MNRREERLMAKAVRAAKRAEGSTFPNPPVGAVIAVGEQVLAIGYHRRAGEAHAEVDALRQLAERPPRGATLYVTLEPCAHHGRTPPCTEAILRSGLRRVVVGTPDPHPHTNGRGIETLRKGGVEVLVGVLEEPCRELIRGFASVAERGRPYVLLKVAATLDGRIATRTGHSQWVTGEQARREGHRLRGRLDAILVGGGTVRSDDPRLTCRLVRGRDPIRIVLSATLDLPDEAKVFSPSKIPGWPSAIVLTTKGAPAHRARALEAAGAEVMRLGARHGRVDIGAALEALGRRGLTTLLVEGGSQVAGGFLEGGWVDELYWFVAPKLLGDPQAVPALSGGSVRKMGAAWLLDRMRVRHLGPDLLLQGHPCRDRAARPVEGDRECSPA